MAQVKRETFEQNRTYNYVTRSPEEFDAMHHAHDDSTSLLGLISGGAGGFISAFVLCLFFGFIVAITRGFFKKFILCCVFVNIAFYFFSSSFAIFALGSSLGMLFGHPDKDSPKLGTGFFLLTQTVGVILMVSGLVGCIRNTFFP